jgi:hypothetical protein
MPISQIALKAHDVPQAANVALQLLPDDDKGPYRYNLGHEVLDKSGASDSYSRLRPGVDEI